MASEDSKGSSGPGSLSPATSNAEISPFVEREIERLVEESIGRFGITGRIRVVRGQLELHHPRGIARASLGAAARGWEGLVEAERRHRASELARELARCRASSDSTRPGSSLRLAPWFAILAFGGIAAGGYYFWASREAQPPPPPRELTSRPDEGAPERRARSSLVCEATRSRVLRGATVSPTDVEGWVVELLGFRRGSVEPLHTSPRLATFVLEPAAESGSLFIWKEEPELARILTSDTRVVISPEEIRGDGGAAHPGIRLSFRGALVDAYFDPERRPRYYHVASALAQELALTHAGLYARCEDGTTHHLGSWFRGVTDADAMTSLLYVLGAYAEPPHIAPRLAQGADGSFDRSLAFSRFEAASAALSRPLLSSLLGPHGGMIIGKSGEGVVISFPFQDGNRASRTSREVMRSVGLNQD